MDEDDLSRMSADLRLTVEDTIDRSVHCKPVNGTPQVIHSDSLTRAVT